MEGDVLTREPMAAGYHVSPGDVQLSMTRPDSVGISARFEAPPERVFDAWLDPRIAGQWLFATASRPAALAEIEAHAGGSFRFEERSDGWGDVHAGRYLEITRPARLVFTLLDRKYPRETSRVSVRFVALARGCEVSLVQEGVPLHRARHVEGRWAGMLYGLGELLGRQRSRAPRSRRESR